ncbi:MAG TPA: hypothetical protein VLX28_01720, partial [Thermoanaerobaculia bacterium]|nr:hypothetical protein [Thermoanaerobaculia bacterium]
MQPFQDFFADTPSDLAPQDPMKIVPRDPKATAAEREYKIVQTTTSADQPAKFSDVVEKVQKNNYRLEFLIALVPDPVDSGLALSFDQAIKAIQDAYSTAGYLPDRFWLPWKPAEKLLYRKLPGVLLFRKSSESRLAAVLLVGETPKIGVQKVALNEAITMASQFMTALHQPLKIRILGPSFSGSVDSLHRVLSSFPKPDLIVSGSATAKEIPATLGKAFRRTVLSDDILQQQALCFLQERLGWNLEKVALLTESDTAYGQKSDSGLKQIRFPSGLSNIRNEWEKANVPKSSAGPIETPKTTLSLALGENSTPVDLVPEFSPLALRSKDLALANVLQAIARDGIRYVGILATDPRDKLFLAKRIREFSPDVVLFTFDNNLLYAHPQYAASMDGLLVLANFPLTERKRAAKGEPAWQQLNSDFEAGIFQAVKKLIDPEAKKPVTKIWISAIGNGSLWPIASFLPLTSGGFKCAGATPILPFTPVVSHRNDKVGFEALILRADLLLMSFALVLLGLAAWLWQSTRSLLAASSRSPGGHCRVLRLLGLGLFVLWLVGGSLLILGTMSVSDSLWMQVAVSTLLGFCYLLAIRCAERPSIGSLRTAFGNTLKGVFRGPVWPFVGFAM